MKHVNYLSFFLLTLFSISFISCSDDDDNKLNTGITNQSWTEGKSLEISQDNELSVSFNAAAKWVASVTSGADWCKLNTTSGTKGQSTLKLSVETMVRIKSSYMPVPSRKSPVRLRYPQHAVQKP